MGNPTFSGTGTLKAEKAGMVVFILMVVAKRFSMKVNSNLEMEKF